MFYRNDSFKIRTLPRNNYKLELCNCNYILFQIKVFLFFKNINISQVCTTRSIQGQNVQFLLMLVQAIKKKVLFWLRQDHTSNRKHITQILVPFIISCDLKYLSKVWKNKIVITIGIWVYLTIKRYRMVYQNRTLKLQIFEIGYGNNCKNFIFWRSTLYQYSSDHKGLNEHLCMK